jgi:hypothetical protein
MTPFALACAGILIHGSADHIDVSGNSDLLYTEHVRLFHGKWNYNPRGVYDDGGQYQVTIARDRSRIWVQMDADDNPRDPGVMVRCRKVK